MDGIAVWRGQVPAWECGPDGRWSAGHVAGAFDEAARMAGTSGFQIEGTSVATLPSAGSLLEIRTVVRDGSPVHRMLAVPEGTVIAERHVVASGGTPGRDFEQEPAWPGSTELVRAWECDIMGHMNVQFYAQRLTASEAFLLGGPDAAARSVRPTEHRFRFVSEVKAGEAVACRATALERRGRARFDIRAMSGRLAALVESDFDAAVEGPPREAVPGPFADDAASGPVWKAGDWTPSPVSMARMSVLGRNEVAAWEVDHTGVMPPRFFFSRMAAGVPFLLAQMGLDRPFMAASGFGRAAVGYRVRYLRWPRAGDVLELRSGIGKVRETNWRFRHAFVDIADGEAVCTAESVIVLLDLATRRAVPLPQAVRIRAASLEI